MYTPASVSPTMVKRSSRAETFSSENQYGLNSAQKSRQKPDLIAMRNAPRALDVLSMALATGRKCSVVNPLADADQVLRRAAVVLSASAGSPAFAPEQTFLRSTRILKALRNPVINTLLKFPQAVSLEDIRWSSAHGSRAQVRKRQTQAKAGDAKLPV